jgi:hypothetical protein
MVTVGDTVELYGERTKEIEEIFGAEPGVAAGVSMLSASVSGLPAAVPATASSVQ